MCQADHIKLRYDRSVRRWSRRLLTSSLSRAVVVAAMFSFVAHAQAPGSQVTQQDESVEEFVRDLRSGAPRPAEDRAIDVYSDRYVIGEREFQSIEELRDYIEDYPPSRFPTVNLRDCEALARAKEVEAMKAELDLAYIQRMSESGYPENLVFESGRGSPRECIWSFDD